MAGIPVKSLDSIAMRLRPKPEQERGELAKKPKEVPLPSFGVVVFESRHAPGFAPSVLEHDYAKFLLVIAGHARLEADRRAFRLGPHSLVHVPPRRRHFYEDLAADPVTLYAILYRPAVLPAAVLEPLFAAGMAEWNLGALDPGMARAVGSDFQEMLYEQHARRDGWELAVCSCLGHLVVRTLRLALRHAGSLTPEFAKGVSSAERVATYAAQLASGFYRQQTLDEAATATGLSRRRFTEIFRSVTGNAWRKHIEKLRLEHAQRLLLETESSVLAVAFECGFENASNFHRAFKAAFGCSPSLFRQRARRG